MSSAMPRRNMQRASQSIGTIAAALAKAQTELTNPEKSLIGTIGSMRPSPADSILCAKAWAGTRLQPYKRRL